MIVTTLAEADAYASLAPGFATGLAWLRAFDPATPEGRHPIDGDEVYALVQRYHTGPATQKRFESHLRNLDIQWVASGTERILHAPVALMEVETPYDDPDDIVFYAEPKASSSILMRPDDVAIFLPPDGHKPGCMAGGRDAVHKVVVKVRRR